MVKDGKGMNAEKILSKVYKWLLNILQEVPLVVFQVLCQAVPPLPCEEFLHSYSYICAL